MEQGQFASACPKLVESQRLDPAVGTLLYLGECYFRNGQTATAWATFLSAAEAAARAGQPDREKIARQRASELFGLVSRLVIEVPAAVQVPALEVKLDTAPMGAASWGVQTAVDPGKHLIEVSAPHYLPWSTTIVIPANGSQSTVTVPRLNRARMVPSTSDSTLAWHAPGADPTVDAGTRARNQRIIGIATAGVGVVGLATGVIFGLKAKSKEADSEAYCWQTDNSRCGPKGVSLISEGKHYATISTVGFVFGGLGVVGGAVVYLTAPKPPPKGSTQRVSNVRLVPVLDSATQGGVLLGEF
jgi:hypothetical protein